MKQNTGKQSESNRRGSGIIAALIFIVVISLIAANTLLVLQQRYRSTNHAIAWQEAMLASEAGVDLAMSEIRKAANGNDADAWEGWGEASASEEITTDPSDLELKSNVILRTSEGGQRSWVKVLVSAPDSLVDSTDEQWFRIRATGVAEIPGAAIAAGESIDIALRKLNLVSGDVPQATRTVEVIAKPISAFQKALISDGIIDMNNHNIVVDSYDSRDPNYSKDGVYVDGKYTNGKYDSTKFKQNGDIATNGKVIQAGGAHIYGDASTNGGILQGEDQTVTGVENVTGEIRDDFYQELPLVYRPNNFDPDYGPMDVTSSYEMQATAGTPSRYLINKIKLGGQDTVTIKGAADGSRTYVEIVVSGDIDLGGNGAIVLEPGVRARIFFEGDCNLTGNGISNPGSPLDLQLYGASTRDGNPVEHEMVIAGNGGFSGTVYAPMANIEMKGGGSQDSVFGAFAGKTVYMNGVTSVHYDEALRNGGLVSDYKIVSWFEDIRHHNAIDAD